MGGMEDVTWNNGAVIDSVWGKNGSNSEVLPQLTAQGDGTCRDDALTNSSLGGKKKRGQSM